VGKSLRSFESVSAGEATEEMAAGERRQAWGRRHKKKKGKYPQAGRSAAAGKLFLFILA
jgi:hypothetical protein